MRNYIQRGDALTILAPANIASGAGLLVDSLFGIANGKATTGENVVLSTVGVFSLPKVTANAFALGAKVYWATATNNVTSTVGANKLIGVAVEVAGAGTTAVKVRLNGSFS